MVYRTRYAGEYPQADSLGRYVRNYPDAPNVLAPWQTSWWVGKLSSASRISDVVGNPTGFNPVVHTSIKVKVSPNPIYLRDPPSYWGVPQGDGLYFPIVAGDNYGPIDYPWFPGISAATLSNWSIEAFNKFHDQIPTTISLANSLYELKDIKGLIPTFDRKSLTKTAGNNFLAFEFGVLPMVSDIKAIVNMSEAVDKRIKHLISVNGRSTRLSFSREQVYEEPVTFWKNFMNPLDTVYSGDANGVVFSRQSAKVTFKCGGSLFQDLTDLEDSASKLKALVASSGFNKPARVVWNAIPYSFVVDWFFSLGKLLDTLSVQPFGGEYRVDRVGYSTIEESTWIATVKHQSTGTIVGNPTLGTVHAKRYTRKSGFPAYSLFLTDGLLSPTQLLLGLAMLNQHR
jgi:hypothetical protein